MMFLLLWPSSLPREVVAIGLVQNYYSRCMSQYQCVQPVKSAGKPLSAARNSRIAFWLVESWRNKTANSSIMSAGFAVTDSNKFVTDVLYWIERRFFRCKALSQCFLKQAFAPFRFQNARVFVVEFNRRIETDFLRDPSFIFPENSHWLKSSTSLIRRTRVTLNLKMSVPRS